MNALPSGRKFWAHFCSIHFNRFRCVLPGELRTSKGRASAGGKQRLKLKIWTPTKNGKFRAYAKEARRAVNVKLISLMLLVRQDRWQHLIGRSTVCRLPCNYSGRQTIRWIVKRTVNGVGQMSGGLVDIVWRPCAKWFKLIIRHLMNYNKLNDN